MTRHIALAEGRKLLWIASSLDDLRSFPEQVQSEMAAALEVARLGGKHPAAKPWKGLGPSVFEIAIDDGDAYRSVYTVQFKEAVYVLHAFQKKSTRGIKTSQRDVDTVANRLTRAQRDYFQRYGKKTKQH